MSTATIEDTDLEEMLNDGPPMCEAYLPHQPPCPNEAAWICQWTCDCGTKSRLYCSPCKVYWDPLIIKAMDNALLGCKHCGGRVTDTKWIPL